MEKITINNYTLDQEQTAPIIDNPKYSIIIAGAGSGKTLTLVGKIKYLLEHKIFTPEQICCISFTNETTDNLRKNILENCKQDIQIFTFHKLALSILKSEKIHYQISPSDLLEYVIEEFFYSHCFDNQNLINCTFKYFNYFFKSQRNWNCILNSYHMKQTKKLMITFINLFLCNNYSIESFLDFFKSKKDKNLLLIIYAIYILYQTEKDSTKSIDFDDMISLATKTLQQKKCDIPYKIILIDEFQDTSIIRFQLIEEIVKQTDASLCVVGDDYQSIYHFSGCDLQLFLEFHKKFPNTKIYKLQKTYRNSQELISLAGKFIQKNPHQIHKNLISKKRIAKPVKLCYYSKIDNVLENIIKQLPQDKSILILGRNHFDLNVYTKKLTFTQDSNNQIYFKKFQQHNIRFLTIHTSKGLESDIVIILNLSNNEYGFPSLKLDESIIKHVKKGFNYPFEEERRLFYVALTRTKNEVYLLIPENSPSKFIKEIKTSKYIEKNFIS